MKNNDNPSIGQESLGADPGSADEIQPTPTGAVHRTSAHELSSESLGYGNPLKDEIAAVAYRRWQRRGCPFGSPEVDWSEAEQELRSKP